MEYEGARENLHRYFDYCLEQASPDQVFIIPIGLTILSNFSLIQPCTLAYSIIISET